jgi:DNA-binding CsgD family transcriptional regulator
MLARCEHVLADYDCLKSDYESLVELNRQNEQKIQIQISNNREHIEHLNTFLEANDSDQQRKKAILHEQATRRELEVLRLVGEGRTTKWIADDLHISARTVDSHRSNLMHKLDEPNTAGLAQWASYIYNLLGCGWAVHEVSHVATFIWSISSGSQSIYS